jgi:hypothetical protein
VNERGRHATGFAEVTGELEAKLITPDELRLPGLSGLVKAATALPPACVTAGQLITAQQPERARLT